MDDFRKGVVTLQFIVPRLIPGTKEAVAYPVQFTIQLEPEAAIRNRCNGARGFSEARFADAMMNRGRREHRVLLLWLKAALEAVAEKLVSFEALFLPFMVGTDGKTVADVAVPHLPRLVTGGAGRLLTVGDDRG
jgi:hypothetical protein